ncbi:hypothetical protein C8J57DRAFT_1177304 [Mycena rebaudengoi]|nr:hypothetical protein C8J57DRAFT_1177304 [Mycena rebaudengoi]
MPIHTYNNPFGGWTNPNAGQAPVYAPWGNGAAAPPPSIFGALPYPTPPPAGGTPHSQSDPAPAEMTTFYLASLNPTVLNCTVSGPRGRVYYHVSTDSMMPGYTVFKSAERKSMALIEWQKHPRVEVRGAVSKQEARALLALSRDQTYRTMTIRGARYTVAPQDQYIVLSTAGSSPRFLGRISRGEECVVLEMTPHAIQLGLLDTAVVVAVLLQCGHAID